MNREQLQNLAENFYQAIIEAKTEFSWRDRMHNFPGGCCDDASDLFGYYILHQYGIESKQCTGLYDDGIVENRTNHAWLLVDGIIVDMTYGQFKLGEKVYVGKENDFYRSLTDKEVYENYDIENCPDRLWPDYQKILEHLK